MAKPKSSYHHGDLRPSLLTTATKMINQGGLEALSLRKLAEQVGVSRTATYHHFKNKHDLLCAVAAQGFTQWRAIEDKIFNEAGLPDREKYLKLVISYIKFAVDNPAIYELMYGHTLWKNNQANEALRDVAYPCFQYQVEMTRAWQEKGLFPKEENTLRLSQVTWSTIHGLARLVIDGIYPDISSVEEMCECAVNLFLQSR